ncbi:AnsA L-asparaginase II [Rhabdaerophilaceae bacterium]
MVLSMANPALVEITRGGIVESGHSGAIAVMDADGAVVFSMGDIDRPIFPRSAIKGFQALPLVESGAADRFGLTNEELALACSSHSGEQGHVETAAGMLAKAGRSQTCLECGAHWPSNELASRTLFSSGAKPTPLHNNCSGKHSGFVCTAIELGHDPSGYIGPDHPTMKVVTAAISDMAGFDLSRAARGVDGCSIPTFAIPLRHIARGFAQFATGSGLSATRAAAVARLRAAAATSPFHVAGTGRFDTLAMSALGARAFTKTGAEGVYCAALPELGLGIALKIDDGATRASETAMAALLTRFLELDDLSARAVTARLDFVISNWNGLEVGRMRPVSALRA